MTRAVSENAFIRAFQAADAFRDGLQTLVTVAHAAGFTVGMEAQEEEGTITPLREMRTTMTQMKTSGGKGRRLTSRVRNAS